MGKEWNCPNCGAQKLTGEFCGNCGTKKPALIWFYCEKCRKFVDTKFCPDCGEQAKAIEIILKEEKSWRDNKWGTEGYFKLESPNLSDEELKKILGFTMIEKPWKYGKKWTEAYTLARCSDTDGFTDWQLPSVKELETVYKILKFYGLETSGLRKGNSTFFWSYTTKDSDRAWLVNFGSGGVICYNKSSTSSVRCVR